MRPARQATRIDLCGETLVDGHPGVVSGRLELLLAILLLAGERGIRREELVEHLWPAQLPSSPNRALDPLLSRLRRTVGEIEGRGLVRLGGSAPPRCDLLEARDTLALAHATFGEDPAGAGTLAAAAAKTLASPMLPAHDVPWAARQRVLQEEQACEALALAAEARLASGTDTDGARRAAEALVAACPLREAPVGLLMRTLVAQGETALALAAYDALWLRLDAELGVTPGRMLRNQHQRLLAPEDAPAVPAPAPLRLPTPLAAILRTPLAGRETVLAELTRAVERSGTPRLALVHGPSGAGKTRLVAELAAQRHEAGELVLLGRCPPAAAAAFAPLVDALRPLVLATDPAVVVDRLGPLAADLAGLVPALHRRLVLPPASLTDPLAARHRLFEAVGALLATAPSPVLLVVDDLQWLDRSSAALLAHLLRAEELGGLAIVATMAGDFDAPPDPAAVLLDAALAPTTLTASDLDLDAVREMVAAAHPGDAPDARAALADRLLERTGGRPLLVAASLADRSELGDGPALTSAVQRALQRAGSGVRTLVETVAVDHAGAGVPVLARACGMTEPELGDHAVAAHAAGLLLPTMGIEPLGVPHLSVREAVLTHLDAERRATLHARLAEAYEAVHGRDADRVAADIARHWAGANGGADQAARYGERAARLALEGRAYEQAATQASVARRQLEHPAGDPHRRLALLMLEGDAHNRASELAQARVPLAAALLLAQELGENALVARIALEHGGHRLSVAIRDQELIDALEIGLAACGEDDVVHARLSGRLAAALVDGPVGRRDTLGVAAIAHARASGDPQALAETLVWRHVSEMYRGDPDARAILLDEAEALARTHGLTAIALHTHMLRFSDLLEAGRLREAREEFAVWESEAEVALVPYHRWAAAVCRPTLALVDGDLRGAADALAAASRLAVPLGDDPVVVSAHSAHELVIGMWSGAAEAVVGSLAALVADDAAVPAFEAALATAEVLAGQAAPARARVERVAAAGFDGIVDANRLATASFLTLAGVGSGASREALETLHAVLAPHADRWVVQHYGGAVHGPVAVRLALLETALGRYEEAWASLARADTSLGAAPGLMLALDRDHAEVRLLRATGEPERAAELAARARQAAQAAGLTGWTVLLEP